MVVWWWCGCLMVVWLFDGGVVVWWWCGCLMVVRLFDGGVVVWWCSCSVVWLNDSSVVV